MLFIHVYSSSSYSEVIEECIMCTKSLNPDYHLIKGPHVADDSDETLMIVKLSSRLRSGITNVAESHRTTNQL